MKLTAEQYEAIVRGIERGTVKVTGGTITAPEDGSDLATVDWDFVVDPNDHETLRILGVET